MGVYGVDYLTDDEEILYLVVDASSEEEARKKAGKLLNTYGLPKRNILQLERLEWLEQ